MRNRRKTYKIFRRRECFEQECYQEWAAREFYERLRNAGPYLFREAENFVHEMDRYACSDASHVKDRYKKKRWMFSVAYDVGTDLLDFMYTLSEP